MKQIASVELTNFRSHAHSVIEFGPLTSIIGENDHGKSNVFRGMEMVLDHQPFSEGHLRYGTREGAVKVVFTDGTWVERTRRGSKQSCTLFDGKNARTFDTIKDIAEIVYEFTGFKPVSMDKNAKAESVQIVPIDAPQSYLVAGTSSDGVLRRVNRLMSGAGIETARVVLEKELRVIEKSNEAQERDLERQQATVDCLQDPVWDEVSEGYEATKTKLQRLESLGKAHSLLVEYKDIADTGAVVVAAKEAFGDSLQRTYALKDRILELKALTETVAGLVSWKEVIEENLGALDIVYKRDEELAGEMQALQSMIDQRKAEEQAKKIAEDQKKAMEEAKVCPTCNRPL